MTAVLTADGIARQGPHGALPAVSLRLEAGRALAVRGPEPVGAALVKCLYRTYEPDRGELCLEVDGERVDLAHADPRSVAWVRRRWLGIHDGRLRALPNRSAVRVAAGAAPDPEREEAARGLLLTLGVDRVDDPVGLLDDHERRLVDLAARLQRPAPILLAHRPRAGLTGEARRHVGRALTALRESGVAVLVTVGTEDEIEHDDLLELGAPG